MRRSDAAKKPKTGTVRVPLAMSSELDSEIDTTAKSVGLSKQDTMRLAIQRGLKVLHAQMTSEPKPQAA